MPKFEGPHLVQQRDGLQVCWVRTIKAKKAKSLRRVASWLHFEWALFWLRKRSFQRPDVIVVSSLSLLTIINGLLLRARFKARLIIEIRDIWPLTLVEEGGFSRRNPLVISLGLIERLGYRYADAIVGTMPNLGEHVANVLGYAKPAHCVPMGFAPRAIAVNEPLPAEYVESYLPRESFVIGYAGTIGITNALDPFFEAVEAMRDDPSTQFLVVGDGSLLPDYQNRFSHLPNLTFGPKVPKAAVQSVLAECDLLYLSTHPLLSAWLEEEQRVVDGDDGCEFRSGGVGVRVRRHGADAPAWVPVTCVAGTLTSARVSSSCRGGTSGRARRVAGCSTASGRAGCNTSRPWARGRRSDPMRDRPSRVDWRGGCCRCCWLRRRPRASGVGRQYSRLSWMRGLAAPLGVDEAAAGSDPGRPDRADPTTAGPLWGLRSQSRPAPSRLAAPPPR